LQVIVLYYICSLIIYIDRALKRFKRKFDRTGTMRQLRKRQAFSKPSVERRAQVQKAQYIQHLRDQEEI